MGVSMAPGAMLLTVTPIGASSTARLRIIIFNPPLLTQYGVKLGKGSSSCTELMLMILPPRCVRRHIAANAWLRKNGPLRLTASTRS